MKFEMYRNLPIFGKKRCRIVDWSVAPTEMYPPVDVKGIREKYDSVLLQVDGGGMRGTIPALALFATEHTATPGNANAEYKPGTLYQNINYWWGTSTGAIIAACLAAGITTREVLKLYLKAGPDIFTPRPAAGCGLLGPQYNPVVLYKALRDYLGDLTFAELADGGLARGPKITNWESAGNDDYDPLCPGLRPRGKGDSHFLTLITVNARTRETIFCSADNAETRDWRIADVVMGSTSVPVVFPAHFYEEKDVFLFDGFVGAYPCTAANAAEYLLYDRKMSAEEFFLLSVGTGYCYPENDPKKVQMYGLNKGLIWMMGGILTGMDHSQEDELQELQAEEGLNYYRWNPRLDKELDMADDKPELTYDLLEFTRRELSRQNETPVPSPVPIPGCAHARSRTRGRPR